ncbi:MAG TPA: T9SS type A sorting domain-containing protein, partial [Chitinophagales bacterium]|nr:T9SS type A sorting domain-containing protein [Chitinophagales bacterium]
AFGTRTTSIEGLYPFYGQEFEPWNWYDPNCYDNSQQMQTLNPGSNPTKGNLYIDTIMMYTLPRLYKLFINPSFQTWNGIRNVGNNVNIGVYPNPATQQLTINTGNNRDMINAIRLFDVTGRIMLSAEGINNYTSTIDISGLSNGLYMLDVQFTDGSNGTQKVVVQKQH